MAQILRFAAPRTVEIVDQPDASLEPGQMRVQTLWSGISAGTELTAYRGTNPYLTSSWDPELRLFSEAPDTAAYPLDGWGYSEVGVVVESACEPDDAPLASRLPRVGETVWGIWGHRSHGVLHGEALRGQVLPDGADPLAATFVRVGSIALNAVLQADITVGSTVVIIGQGVIGLLATSLATAAGATVLTVDGVERRRAESLARGARDSVGLDVDVARLTRTEFAPIGVDVVIELSGTYAGLQAATRIAGVDGVVVAAGFYQGEGTALRLGNEFHHNRVQILASQIGQIPNRLRARWDVQRLQRVVVDRISRGELSTASLVTHRFPLADASAAYELLDANAADVLQAVLEFPR